MKVIWLVSQGDVKGFVELGLSMMGLSCGHSKQHRPQVGSYSEKPTISVDRVNLQTCHDEVFNPGGQVLDQYLH